MTEREWGVVYTRHGNIHTKWGYIRNPLDQLDADGQINIGKRDWVDVYEIKSRPVMEERSEWQSPDCPWRKETDA
jgi:hypothetical protein